MLRKLFDERNIHRVFQLSLWLKGAFAAVEIAAGAAAFFVTRAFLLNLTLWVTQGEFSEDPHDLVANFLLRSVAHLSVSAQTFAGVYLLAHGVVKLWLVIGLLRQRLWFYPVSQTVFALFIAYQLYRYVFTHSPWLLVLTGLDLVVILLTWHEYRVLRQLGRHAASLLDSDAA